MSGGSGFGGRITSSWVDTDLDSDSDAEGERTPLTASVEASSVLAQSSLLSKIPQLIVQAHQRVKSSDRDSSDLRQVAYTFLASIVFTLSVFRKFDYRGISLSIEGSDLGRFQKFFQDHSWIFSTLKGVSVFESAGLDAYFSYLISSKGIDKLLASEEEKTLNALPGEGKLITHLRAALRFLPKLLFILGAEAASGFSRGKGVMGITSTVGVVLGTASSSWISVNSLGEGLSGMIACSRKVGLLPHALASEVAVEKVKNYLEERTESLSSDEIQQLLEQLQALIQSTSTLNFSEESLSSFNAFLPENLPAIPTEKNKFSPAQAVVTALTLIGAVGSACLPGWEAMNKPWLTNIFGGAISTFSIFSAIGWVTSAGVFLKGIIEMPLKELKDWSLYLATCGYRGEFAKVVNWPKWTNVLFTLLVGTGLLSGVKGTLAFLMLKQAIERVFGWEAPLSLTIIGSTLSYLGTALVNMSFSTRMGSDVSDSHILAPSEEKKRSAAVKESARFLTGLRAMPSKTIIYLFREFIDTYCEGTDSLSEFCKSSLRNLLKSAKLTPTELLLMFGETPEDSERRWKYLFGDYDKTFVEKDLLRLLMRLKIAEGKLSSWGEALRAVWGLGVGAMAMTYNDRFAHKIKSNNVFDALAIMGPVALSANSQMLFLKKFSEDVQGYYDEFVKEGSFKPIAAIRAFFRTIFSYREKDHWAIRTLAYLFLTTVVSGSVIAPYRAANAVTDDLTSGVSPFPRFTAISSATTNLRFLKGWLDAILSFFIALKDPDASVGKSLSSAWERICASGIYSDPNAGWFDGSKISLFGREARVLPETSNRDQLLDLILAMQGRVHDWAKRPENQDKFINFYRKYHLAKTKEEKIRLLAGMYFSHIRPAEKNGVLTYPAYSKIAVVTSLFSLVAAIPLFTMGAKAGAFIRATSYLSWLSWMPELMWGIFSGLANGPINATAGYNVGENIAYFLQLLWDTPRTAFERVKNAGWASVTGLAKAGLAYCSAFAVRGLAEEKPLFSIEPMFAFFAQIAISFLGLNGLMGDLSRRYYHKPGAEEQLMLQTAKIEPKQKDELVTAGLGLFNEDIGKVYSAFYSEEYSKIPAWDSLKDSSDPACDTTSPASSDAIPAASASAGPFPMPLSSSDSDTSASAASPSIYSALSRAATTAYSLCSSCCGLFSSPSANDTHPSSSSPVLTA